MRKLDAALQGVERLGIDTAPLIYFVKQHPEFAPVVRSVIQRAENGAFGLATSSLTLTEVLTLPRLRRQQHCTRAALAIGQDSDPSGINASIGQKLLDHRRRIDVSCR